MPTGEPNAYVRHFEDDPSRRKSLLLATVRPLVEAGYLKLGQLDRRDLQRRETLEWVEWPGTIHDQITRLADAYLPQNGGDDSGYYACWLNLTDAGLHAIELLPKPDKRFFNGLL